MRRGSGILLHMTSLPSPYGIGDMGPQAYQFADYLAETKQSFWQILPLNPTDPAHGNSPYFSSSAFGCNPLLISPDIMVLQGLLNEEDLEPVPDFPKSSVDYQAVINYKTKLFYLALEKFKRHEDLYEYEKFCSENSAWVDDYALFMALRSNFSGCCWNQWPLEIRDRQPETLQYLREQHKDRIEYEKFLQFLFYQQWVLLKSHCNRKGIQIIGDMPIYVTYDSVDVWTNPELFKLDGEKRAYAVGGVPPDYFSATGQLWGNPVYQWDILRKTRYVWWIERMKSNLRLFNFVRLDHFRGFVAYWEVPASEKNAINGRWIEAPALDFFNEMMRKFPVLPIIVEDLGVITPDVREIMHRFDFPGMKILLFAFGEDLPTNPYAPHNLVKSCIVYTGTHDNNPIKGWFEKEATPQMKERLFQYLGREVLIEELNWEFIRLAMMSVSDVVMFPLQDILGLGEEARMNRPSSAEHNWQWRLLHDQLTPSLSEKLLKMTEIYGRA